MGQFIKIDGSWKNIVSVYKKVNGHWVEQTEYNFDDNLYLFNDGTIDMDMFLIVAEDSYTGKQFYLIATLNDTRVYPTWSITSGSQYVTINSNGKVTILQGAQNNLITVRAAYSTFTKTKSITVSYDNQLSIEGNSTMSGTSGNVIALYNNTVVNPTWSITSGNAYATINSSGEITILSSGEITVSATYEGYTSTKVITLTYNENSSSQTYIDPDTGAVTTTETTTTTDPETGATTETSTSTTTNDDGSTSTSETETTTNTDGSSTTTTSTTNSDGSSSESTSTTSSPDSDGSVTTTESSTVTNADGSSTESASTTTVNEDGSSSSSSSTVNYDENGNQTSSQSSTVNVSAADSDGAITTETSSTTTNADGTSSESTSTLIENEDGSSSSQSQTTNYDENGDTTGSTTNTTDVNADGSSQSSTTNFNAEGDPTDQQNVGVDTGGNVSTQDVEFVDNGGSNLEPLVTGYTIDTTASEGEGKEIEGNGINTEFVPFKFASEGFVVHIVFKSTAQDQPRPPITEDTEDTGTNYLYTVLGAKATAKIGNIWPGFEIRWTIPKTNPDYSDTSKCTLQFCRTLSGETSTTRTQFTTGHNGDNVYDLTITYNPNVTNKFVVRNNITNTNIQSVNKTIQSDVELDMTIGYSTDHNGDQIRHSNVTVYDFTVSRLNS